MKKLVAIGIAVVALAAPVGAAAKPLPALSNMYRTGPAHPVLTLERGQSERFAASNPIRQQASTGVASLTLERGVSERFAPDNPARGDLVTSPRSVGSPDFQWGDAGIGAGVLFGLVALLATAVVGVRHHGHLGTS